MSLLRLDIDDRQVVMHTEGSVSTSTQELVECASFARVLDLPIDHLGSHSPAALAEMKSRERGAARELVEDLNDFWRRWERFLAMPAAGAELGGHAVPRTWPAPAPCRELPAGGASAAAPFRPSGAKGA